MEESHTIDQIYDRLFAKAEEIGRLKALLDNLLRQIDNPSIARQSIQDGLVYQEAKKAIES